MEILKMIALLIGTALLFTSCSPSPDYTLEYQEKPFSATLLWYSDETKISAFIRSSPNVNAASQTIRNISLEFTSPDTLRGITVANMGGKTTVKSGELEIVCPEAETLLKIADFFDINGKVKNSYISELDGEKLNCIEAISEDGEEYTLYLFPDSGFPRRICGNLENSPTVLDVINFSINE